MSDTYNLYRILNDDFCHSNLFLSSRNDMQKKKYYLEEKLFLLWSSLSIRLLFFEESQKEPFLLWSLLSMRLLFVKKSHKWNEETMCKKIFKKETFPLMVIVKYKAVILRRVTKETFSTMIIVKYDVVILRRTTKGTMHRKIL